MSQRVRIELRAAQPYAGIPAQVTMDGPPFIRYLVVDMVSELKIELAVPVSADISGSERIKPGILPAGRYVTLRHTGPYDGLTAGNAAVPEWAQHEGIMFDRCDTPDGTVWRGRAEHYLTNPAAEPDPAKWEVDVAYLAL